MKFSVIVPVYNAAEYVVRCVDSILNQSYADIEVILVNDGSADGSSNICDDYADNDSRVLVIHKENGGVSDARNAGLRRATGDFVLFVDSDDFIETNACQVFYDSITANSSVEIIASNMKVIHYEKIEACSFLPTKSVLSTGEKFLSLQLDKWMGMFVWRYVYKRILLIENDIYFDVKLRCYEEEVWLPKVLLLASKVLVIDFVHYNYILRDNSLSNPLNQKQITQRAIEQLNVIYECLNQYSVVENKELRRKILDRLVRLATRAIKRGKLYNRKCNHLIEKGVLWENAYTFRTKKKVLRVIIKAVLSKGYYKDNR